MDNVVNCDQAMETRIESLSRFRTKWKGVLVGFVLSVFLQHELGPYFTPRLSTEPRSRFFDTFPHDFSFPPSVEFSVFGVMFLIFSMVCLRKSKHLSLGMAVCGALDLALLVAWLGGGL